MRTAKVIKDKLRTSVKHSDGAGEASPTNKMLEMEDEIRFLRTELVSSKLLVAQLSEENERLRHDLLHSSTSPSRASNHVKPASRGASFFSKLMHDPLSKATPATEDEPTSPQQPAEREQRPINDGADIARIVRVLSVHKVFKHLNPDTLEGLVEKMYAVDFGPGELVIRQGDAHDDRFYIVASGEYSVEIQGDSVADLTPSSSTVKHTYRADGSFGELALRYGNARKASIRCDVHGTLWALARPDFLRMKGSFRRERSSSQESLASVGGE